MKTNGDNWQGNKATNNQIKRNTMKTTILGGFFIIALAVVISGCSNESPITGPDNTAYSRAGSDQIASTPSAETENSVTMISAELYDQKVERIGFEATVWRSDVEGGCWYLETQKSDRYTPYFEENAPRLYAGRRLLVYGYVDENLNSFCMIGPVFHVEKYTNLSREQERPTADAAGANSDNAPAGSNAVDADTHTPAGIDAQSQDELTTLKGYYGSNDEGCMYLSDDWEIIAELHFVQQICPDIPKGKSIAVKGEFSLLTWSPCLLAPLFNVEKFQVLDGDKFVAKGIQESR